MDKYQFVIKLQVNTSNKILVRITSKSPIYISIYVSIISIGIKGIILFHSYKFVSRVGFTSVSERIIIGLVF